MNQWFMYNGYPQILQCNNGSKFKGAFLELRKSVGVRVINGAPYKPSTQESIEIANRTFKRRIRALQTQQKTRGWVRHLREIAIAINTARYRALPKNVSSYMVLFSCNPRWGRCTTLEDIDGEAGAETDEGNAVVGCEDEGWG